MKLLLLIPILALLIVFGCSEGNPLEDIMPVDTLGTVTFVIDEVTRTAFVDTMRTGAAGTVISALWNEGVFANGAPVTLLLRCGLTIPDTVGSFTVHPQRGEHSPSFYVLLGVAGSGGVNTVRYRADNAGGQGSVIVTLADTSIMRGIFNLRVYNEANPSDTKEVAGSFEVKR